MRLDERIAGLLRIRKNLIPSTEWARWQNEIPCSLLHKVPVLRILRPSDLCITFVVTWWICAVRLVEETLYWQWPNARAPQNTLCAPRHCRKRHAGLRLRRRKRVRPRPRRRRRRRRGRKESGRDRKQRGTGGGPITSRPPDGRTDADGQGTERECIA